MPNATSRLAAGAAVIAVVMVIAACGSSSSSSSGPPTAAQLRQGQLDAFNFAACLRSHGVPGFPDPTSPREFKTSVAADQGSPAFDSAQTACKHLLPGGGPPSPSPTEQRAHIAAGLAFARCMRRHGFARFPDPSSTGQLSHQMLASAGIDIHQPAVVQAADACVGVTHGLLTKASVAQFVAGH